MTEQGRRPEPLSPAKATEFIRSKVGPSLGVHWTRHAREQMAARDLLMGDVLHVLKHGFVYDEAEPATQIGLFKYKIESATPNSFGRTVRVVVIPSMSSEVKIVTVMWKDER
jgi:Domain of unknown function (DUF4258)